ncbi:hypothetical protein ACS0TY_002276 [Phlomoides rotata]
MGFYGPARCGYHILDRHLITALVERWCPETHIFHFLIGEVTITLQDIVIIWGLPIEGEPVNMTRAGTYSWESAVLADLYRELYTASQSDETIIAGALSLLHRPTRNIFRGEEVPVYVIRLIAIIVYSLVGLCCLLIGPHWSVSGIYSSNGDYIEYVIQFDRSDNRVNCGV